MASLKRRNDTYVLGISGQGPAGFDLSGLGHDPAAAIVRNGVLIAAAEEERFVRLKHARGLFPYNAIKFCLTQAGIGIGDVDVITGNFDPRLVTRTPTYRTKLLRTPFQAAKIYLGNSVIQKKYMDHIRTIPLFLKEDERLKDVVLKRFKPTDHHLAHLASAFYCSGFSDAALLSLDNAGENVTTVLAHGDASGIRKFVQSYNPDSIGAFYSAFTQYLGFEPDDAEYKVMGLAPYGKPGVNVSDILSAKNGKVHVDPRIFGSYYLFSSYLEKRYGPKRRRGEKISKRHSDIAYAIQKRLEQVGEELARTALERTGSSRLGIAGGVGLNTKMNGALLASGILKDLFIQPAAGDAGTAVGAAMHQDALLHSSRRGTRGGGSRSGATTHAGSRFKMTHASYGPEFDDAYIQNWLKICKVDYERHDDIAGTTAELLAKGNIVGWFQGRMEWGPRALGNRSILADPRNPKMKDTINFYVKFREEFRPFCPSMLDRAAPEYLEGAHDSPFMVLTFRVPDEKQREIPSVVHVDGTVRPQTVTKKDNPLYYRLISEFEKESSVPVLLNTSFNVAGEPIVCRPEEALRTFNGCGLDYLAIGNYLVRKHPR